MQGPIDEKRLKQIFRQPMNIPFPRTPCIAPDGSLCNPKLLSYSPPLYKEKWVEHLIYSIDHQTPLSDKDRHYLFLEDNCPYIGRTGFILATLFEIYHGAHLRINEATFKALQLLIQSPDAFHFFVNYPKLCKMLIHFAHQHPHYSELHCLIELLVKTLPQAKLNDSFSHREIYPLIDTLKQPEKNFLHPKVAGIMVHLITMNPRAAEIFAFSAQQFLPDYSQLFFKERYLKRLFQICQSRDIYTPYLLASIVNPMTPFMHNISPVFALNLILWMLKNNLFTLPTSREYAIEYIREISELKPLCEQIQKTLHQELPILLITLNQTSEPNFIHLDLLIIIWNTLKQNTQARETACSMGLMAITLQIIHQFRMPLIQHAALIILKLILTTAPDRNKSTEDCLDLGAEKILQRYLKKTLKSDREASRNTLKVFVFFQQHKDRAQPKEAAAHAFLSD